MALGATAVARVLIALCIGALGAGCGVRRATPEPAVDPDATAVAVASTTTAAAPTTPDAPASPASTVPAATSPPPRLTPATDPAVAPGEACTDPLGCYGAPAQVGSYDAGAVPEASGAVASRRTPGVWWLLADGPGTDRLWAVGADGATLGAVVLEGFTGVDTEGLATGPCGPGDATPCLYVGDIGDNLAGRDEVTVARLVEPDLAAGVPSAAAVDTVVLRYPTGPVDAEALLVDEAGLPLIVTKQDSLEGPGAQLFAAAAWADGVLEHLGPVAFPGPRLPFLAFGAGVVVTAADATAGRVGVRTYDHVAEFVAPDPSLPLRSFPTWPAHEVPSAPETQSEALAYQADGAGYLTLSEDVGALWLAIRTG